MTTIEPLLTITPSGAADLLVCPYRVSLRRSSQHGLGPGVVGPYVRLGRVCHGVLEDVTRQAIKPGAATGVDFDRFWAARLRAEELEAGGHPLEVPPPAERWPDQAQLKARTRRRAREIVDRVRAAPAAVVLPEVDLSDGDFLHGIADLVLRRPEGSEVIEYKSGARLLVDEDDLEAARRQLLLYGYLEQAVTGTTPRLLEIVPLRSRPVTITPTTRELDDAADAAKALLAAYNSRPDSPDLARPSPKACGSCSAAVRCGPFWEAVKPDWSTPAALELVDLTVEVVGPAATIRGIVSRGTVPAGIEITLQRVPLGIIPFTATTGGAIRAVRAEPRGDDDQIFTLGWASRLGAADG